MRSTFAVLAAATALVSGALVAQLSGSTGPIPLNCDRACLEGVVDQYLKAVVAHDPKAVPLSEDVMYTENYQVVKVGDGFWRTAQGVGNYRHVFADPEFGQVALMGTMREANTRTSDVLGWSSAAGHARHDRERSGVSLPSAPIWRR